MVFAKDIVPTDHSAVTDHVEAFTKQVCEVIVGKNQAVKLSVACLLARGHLLIEDIPGVGKTTLSQALARSLALAFQRIQFTSDLLPADILGNSIFDRAEQRFVFHRGPLFSQVVLIDEVNRATAKTQSALLEAMEEQRISVDGMTYDLPEPFFVVATRIRNTRSVPFRCQNRSLTVFSCGSSWACRIAPANAQCCWEWIAGKCSRS